MINKRRNEIIKELLLKEKSELELKKILYYEINIFPYIDPVSYNVCDAVFNNEGFNENIIVDMMIYASNIDNSLIQTRIKNLIHHYGTFISDDLSYLYMKAKAYTDIDMISSDFTEVLKNSLLTNSNFDYNILDNIKYDDILKISTRKEFKFNELETFKKYKKLNPSSGKDKIVAIFFNIINNNTSYIDIINFFEYDRLILDNKDYASFLELINKNKNKNIPSQDYDKICDYLIENKWPDVKRKISKDIDDLKPSETYPDTLTNNQIINIIDNLSIEDFERNKDSVIKIMNLYNFSDEAEELLIEKFKFNERDDLKIEFHNMKIRSNNTSYSFILNNQKNTPHIIALKMVEMLDNIQLLNSFKAESKNELMMFSMFLNNRMEEKILNNNQNILTNEKYIKMQNNKLPDRNNQNINDLEIKPTDNSMIYYIENKYSSLEKIQEHLNEKIYSILPGITPGNILNFCKIHVERDGNLNEVLNFDDKIITNMMLFNNNQEDVEFVGKIYELLKNSEKVISIFDFLNSEQINGVIDNEKNSSDVRDTFEDKLRDLNNVEHSFNF